MNIPAEWWYHSAGIFSLALGDNIFFGAGFRQKLRQASKNLTEGATIIGYYVNDPRPF